MPASAIDSSITETSLSTTSSSDWSCRVFFLPVPARRPLSRLTTPARIFVPPKSTPIAYCSGIIHPPPDRQFVAHACINEKVRSQRDSHYYEFRGKLITVEKSRWTKTGNCSQSGLTVREYRRETQRLPAIAAKTE